jgi:hypothetical protein
MLFMKCIVHTKLDIYVFFIMLRNIVFGNVRRLIFFVMLAMNIDQLESRSEKTLLPRPTFS